MQPDYNNVLKLLDAIRSPDPDKIIDILDQQPIYSSFIDKWNELTELADQASPELDITTDLNHYLSYLETELLAPDKLYQKIERYKRAGIDINHIDERITPVSLALRLEGAKLDKIRINPADAKSTFETCYNWVLSKMDDLLSIFKALHAITKMLEKDDHFKKYRGKIVPFIMRKPKEGSLIKGRGKKYIDSYEIFLSLATGQELLVRVGEKKQPFLGTFMISMKHLPGNVFGIWVPKKEEMHCDLTPEDIPLIAPLQAGIPIVEYAKKYKPQD